ncbi:MAG: FliM/FliN family flagellar motor switch protein [Phycisphaerae bacterium]
MGQSQQDDIDALLAGVSQLAADAAADIVGDGDAGQAPSDASTPVTIAPAAEDGGQSVPKRKQMPSGVPTVAPACSQRPEDPQRILPLEVPVIVTLAERTMPLSKILALTPGSIIEFDKPSDELLDLMINNRRIGRGQAVKVGENFGLRVTMIGSVGNRVEAMNSA